MDKVDDEIKEVKELQEVFDHRMELQKRVEGLICEGKFAEASELLRRADEHQKEQKEG